MDSKIMVSIDCITYNHEEYIRETFDGIIMQKTNFEFEILVHDDASTDKTAEIIREYQQKYPNIVKPILQTENQLSKGSDINYEFNISRAKGKYIAFCEGDDYWTDENKLQKQVDYMEANPECTLCFHNARVIDGTTKNQSKLLIPWDEENKGFFYSENTKYESGELQLLGFVPTASFLIPKYVLDNPPQWYFDCPVGDTPIKLIAASHGYAYYMNETMSIYRYNIPNSCTTNWRKESKDKTVKRYDQLIEMLDSFNEYSNYRYEKDIEISKLTWQVQKNIVTENYDDMKDKKFKQYADLLSGVYKIKIYLLIYFPLGFKTAKKANNILRKFT